MAYHYHINDPLGKGPLLNEQGNVVTLMPQAKDPRYDRSNEWANTASKVSYQGHFVDVIKSFPISAPGRIDAGLYFMFVPKENKYYKLHIQTMPYHLVKQILKVKVGESDSIIKEKFSKFSKSKKVVLLHPYSLGPLLHKLTKTGGDPEGLLPLLDLVVTVSERNLNNPSTGCLIS